MSFLDNLENTLKNLEGREERDPNERKRRDAEQEQARAAAPFAEKLRTAAYTQELLGIATQAGYRQRTKVHIAWLGSTLRLEARDKKLDLRPTPEGVLAVFVEGTSETRTETVDLDTGRPEDLVAAWLGSTSPA
jgi:hypothetical protein